MKLAGFSYVRNGFTFGYPFIEAIKSGLDVCDEFVVVVGDSTDGTREAIEAIGSDKIRIVDTVWDMDLRSGGKIFATQCDAALEVIEADWCLHIQADEVLHEDDVHRIREGIAAAEKDPRIEGYLFPFHHFWGRPEFVRTSRKVHRREIRLFKNDTVVRAFRDSQGFRRYPSVEEHANGHIGKMMHVKILDVPVYHYSYLRDPRAQAEKKNFDRRFWHSDEEMKKQGKQEQFDYYTIDKVESFKGTHPALMKPKIDAMDWEFDPKRIKREYKLKYRILDQFEALTGYRIGEYRNYKLL